MPGIFVDKATDDLLEVTMPYFEKYTERIRKVDGARWDEEANAWHLPIESAEDLDDMFEGELIYKYPRHKLLDYVDPPKLPAIFKKVPKRNISGIKLKPHGFQTFGANFLSFSLQQQGVALLGDLMGTGKTLQSIMTALQMKQEGKVSKVLVVVLASTRPQWMKEISKFTNERAVLFADFKAKYRQKDGKRYVSETIEQQKAAMIRTFNQSDATFMVMSHQSVQQNQALLEKAHFDLAIFDEAHYVKNKDSKTNRAIKKLIAPRTKRHKQGYNKGIPYTLLVTGTPVMNYPDDLFGLVSMATDKIFGTWRDFRERYLVLNEYKDVVGYQNLPELLKNIESFYIRRTDAEIGLSLPSIIEDDIWIDPHPKQIKLDKSIADYMKTLIQERNNLFRQGKKTQAAALTQQMKGLSGFRIAGGCHPNVFQMSKNEKVRNRYKPYAVKDPLEIPKFQRCLDLVQEIIDNGHKVAIFVDSLRMTVLLHKYISKFTRAVRYIGGLSNEKRERRREKFNNDPACRVIILNKAGSTGLNLQAGRYLINYDLPHNPAEWNQRKYRIRRIDSTHDKVYIINLINKGLYDEKMRERLEQKQASFNSTMENSDATTKFHQSVAGAAPKKKRRKKPANKLKDEDMIVWT